MWTSTASLRSVNACLLDLLPNRCRCVSCMIWFDRALQRWCVQVVGHPSRQNSLHSLHDGCSAANFWAIHCQAIQLGHDPRVFYSVAPTILPGWLTLIEVSADVAPSRQSSSMISSTCRGSSEIPIPSSVHWTLRFSKTISLASVGLAPIICFRVSWRFRRDCLTASTSLRARCRRRARPPPTSRRET